MHDFFLFDKIWLIKFLKMLGISCIILNFPVNLELFLFRYHLNNHSVVGIWPYFDGLEQDSGISIANALEIPQFCNKPLSWGVSYEVKEESVAVISLVGFLVWSVCYA